jgi:N-acetylmuramoyl-L-alanine amidase
MVRTRFRHGFGARVVRAALSVLVLTACATARGTSPSPTAPPRWPPIPRADGPLAIRVQYPSPNALIVARDSTFLLGTVQHGGATLTVNGAPVEVRPNGAFLAWVAMPARDRAAFELVASVPGAAAQRLVLPIRLPAPRTAVDPTRAPWLDTTSIQPQVGLALRGDEPVRVSVRLAAGARAEVVPEPCPAAGGLPAEPLPLLSADGASDVAVREVPARWLRCGGTLRVTAPGASGQTAERPVPAVADGGALGLVRVGTPSAARDTDAVIIARPVPGGTYKWFLLPGTVLRVTGRQGEAMRVALDNALDAWIDADAATPLPAGTPQPRRVASNLRVVPDSGYVDLVVPVGARPAYRVDLDGTNLRLTLYGVTGNSDIAWFQQGDSLVRDVQWINTATDRVEFSVRLQQPVLGWLVLWRDGALVLRLRRPPPVRGDAPLRGLRIAVDPGHPPAGSTGPTGLYEGTATLAVGLRVERMLTERGATPVLLRRTEAPVALGDRPVLARRADAHAFVSIHLNAKPDGANPYRNNGSGTYYFQPHSAGLARAIQAQLLVQLGLSNEGTWFDNLAVVRGAWMPSVLVEGAYVIVPEQEAALRTPEFQEAYARAIVDGLEAWFRTLASGGATRAAP